MSRPQRVDLDAVAADEILRTIRAAEPSVDVMYDVLARLFVTTFLKTRFGGGRMKAYDDFVAIVREQLEYEVAHGSSAGGPP